jgi:serine/threonine protein kinase
MSNLIGKTLLNRFRVDAYIASGGMSVVYKVWDLERNVWLAMKVLHLDLADDPMVLKRFEREARALQKLAHPHIVPFYGIFQARDLTFLLEQYINGPTLKQILKERQSPMSIEESMSYLKAICTALSYAHNNGVVHCDIKPGNVMVDSGGNIFLADFGVARHAESTTTTIGSAGTPAYMAPEQIRGDAVTPATDVYALGVMLFEMLTGQRPFQGTETGSESSGGATAAERVRLAHLALQPPDPSQVNPAIPVTLSNVVLTALAKDPHQRYQTSIELFECACTAIGLDPAQIPDRIAPPAVEAEPEVASVRPTFPRWAWISAGVLGALILLCGGLMAFGLIPTVQELLATETPTPTLTYTPTLTLTATSTPSPTRTLRPSNTPLPPTQPPTYTPYPTFTQAPTDTPKPAAPASSGIIFFVKNIRREAIFLYVNGAPYNGVLPNQVMQVGLPSTGQVTLRWCELNTVTWNVVGHCTTKTYNITAAGQNITLGYH